MCFVFINKDEEKKQTPIDNKSPSKIIMIYVIVF